MKQHDIQCKENSENKLRVPSGTRIFFPSSPYIKLTNCYYNNFISNRICLVISISQNIFSKTFTCPL